MSQALRSAQCTRRGGRLLGWGIAWAGNETNIQSGNEEVTPRAQKKMSAHLLAVR